MKLIDIKNNFLQIPEEDLQFYGNKDPYSYFKIINDKIESKSFFIGPVLDGELLRVEPLEYRFISHAFPNNRMHDSWKTRIDIKIEKTTAGSIFTVKPRTDAALWIFGPIILFSILYNLFAGNFNLITDLKFLAFPAIVIAFYFIERFNARRLIDRFKREVL
jgi:hypothetical protein